jgi:Flp pilus assembly secretin CpaC
MEEFDRPVSRVSYDLLIMQYQTTDSNEWKPSFRIDRMKIGDRNSVSTTLGSVLDFNLDVVGVFGLSFAAELQAAIKGNKAKVFADTTLNGVSGSTIQFQNTNTYRYRDNNLDPETGIPIYSGVTKEIVSGLKLEVTGIVTGDGMITSKITASVSRQGTDVSSTTGNPPPSSEKVITTEVRAKSGEPVILSGLIQNEESQAVSRTPILSKIPLLGNLFKAKNKSSEKTEMVIYLVPSAEIFGQKDESDDFLSHAKELIAEFVGE